MKKIIIFSLFALMAFLPLIAYAGDTQIRYEGTMMIFPARDSVPDLDLDLYDIDLSNIPQEFKPMVGKIYRGYYTSPAAPSFLSGNLIYIFLTGYDQKKDNLEFAVARKRHRKKYR